MTTTTIYQANNYLLHITVLPIEALPGKVHLKIESQYLDASNPHERQVKFDTVLNRGQATLIANVLRSG